MQSAQETDTPDLLGPALPGPAGYSVIIVPMEEQGKLALPCIPCAGERAPARGFLHSMILDTRSAATVEAPLAGKQICTELKQKETCAFPDNSGFDRRRGTSGPGNRA